MPKNILIATKLSNDWSGDYSFLNFASLGNLLRGEYEIGRVRFFCDGMLSAVLFSLLKLKSISRFSFDFTSLAGPVLLDAESHNKPVFFVGGSSSEISVFREKISSQYTDLVISGAEDGFKPESEWNDLYDRIIDSKASVVVAGLGAGKQERFINGLREKGYQGVSFTCGGFITQTAMVKELDYYPRIINTLNLRFAYRMCREPHTIKRYLNDYPKNLFLFMASYLSKSITISVE